MNEIAPIFVNLCHGMFPTLLFPLLEVTFHVRCNFNVQTESLDLFISEETEEYTGTQFKSSVVLTAT